MKLYDHPLSPYAMKIRTILYEKAIPFEKEEIHRESQRATLERLNPRAEVPALVDGDTVLFDSKVIAEYLEETHPTPPLVPADAAGRARCRALELVADTQVDAAAIGYLLFKFFRPTLAAEFPQAMANAEAAMRRVYADLDRRLAGREYLLGKFTRADIAFSPHLGACAFVGLAPGEDTPDLSAWLARMNARESVQRTTQEAIASLEVKVDDPFFDTSRLHWRSDRLEHLVRIGLGPWLLDEIASDRAFLPPLP
ncbi:MAG TPA: glutathione S-transferase family protein [Candidatus Binatia bacterium]|nr:glutathione S-transferase family protein [Candidatus Binatia bacterium]